jgi:hypothetical protein
MNQFLHQPILNFIALCAEHLLLADGGSFIGHKKLLGGLDKFKFDENKRD